MNLNHATNKETGSTLSATEWNNLAADVNELGAGGASNGSSEYLTLSAKNNVELSSPKNINIEPAYDSVNDTFGDISLKPGDDIEFLSEHRPIDKQDEVSLKVHNGDKKPVKLQINASEFTLTTKGKQGDDANVLDINVNSGKNAKGYLKVRAQAIDLRCEDHGGIALQPKGEDSDHNQNKIKFEHGGGDGLEFGTFNTEKTSIFTPEYRFNKDGVVKLATRTTEVSDKADANDPTTAYKYVKQADDFYDVISAVDPACTWKDIISCGSFINTNSITYRPFVCEAEDNTLTTNTTYASATADPHIGEYYTSHNVSEGILNRDSAFTGVDSQMIVDFNDAYMQHKTLLYQFATGTVSFRPVYVNISDITEYILWAKVNQEGPWAPQL